MKRNTQHDHYIESRTAEKSHISVCNPLTKYIQQGDAVAKERAN